MGESINLYPLSSSRNFVVKEVFPSSNGANLRSRARLYLSRIQYLHLAKFPSEKDSTLFTTISGLTQSSPICPNLQKIFLGSGVTTPVMIYNITPLISPALQSITFANTVPKYSTSAVIPPLLNLFKCYGIQLREISYRGPISPCIVQTIAEFSTLRSASIQPNEPPTSADIQSLQGMENLTRLDIHLGILRTDTLVGGWLEHMPSLITLSLSGSWRTIDACIRDRSYKSLQSLSLFLDAQKNKRQLTAITDRDAFSHILVAFPGIRSFSLVLSGEKLVHEFLTISDVLTLRERSLEVLELRNLPVSLSVTDVIDIFVAWPLLKRLCIIPSTTHPFDCEASAILSYISNHATKLQRLDLPLDFSTFLTMPISLPLCRCPLQELNLSKAKNLPQSFHAKLAFCRDLTSLLPRLAIVTSPDSNSSTVKDLQAAIKLGQDVLSSPPKRPDHLF